MSIYIPNYAVVYTRVVSYALKVVELDLYISHFIISILFYACFTYEGYWMIMLYLFTN